MIEALEREAQEIATLQQECKRQAMIYQYADKALVAEYLRETGAAGRRSYEIDVEALNLPFPVWSVIRSAYYDAACDWKRENGGG